MGPFETYTDQHLLELLKNGDENAFAEIYNRHWASLFVVANNRSENYMEAEEAVEDAFISIWKNRATLDIRYSLKTYLAVSVKHNILRRIAGHWAKMQDIELINMFKQVSDSTSLWLDAKELENQLNRCINLLPEKCRIIFLKSRNEGMTHAQIAEELNISTKTVEGHITKAIHLLRKLITAMILMHLH